VLVESLTHNEDGLYVQDTVVQRRMVERITGKILKHIDYVFEYDTYYIDDADYLVVSFGSSARSALAVVRDFRREGVKMGMIKLKTIWPLQDDAIRKLARSASKVFVVENNMGKLVWDIQRILCDHQVYPVSIIDLDIPSPEAVREVIARWL